MAIAILIIGTIATLAFTVGKGRVDSSKVITTYKYINFVMKSIDQYVRIHGRLPCPANGALASTAATYGEESTAADCIGANITVTGNVAIGVLPFKTLELAEPLFYDGWGRKFSYAVDKRLVTILGYNATDAADSPDIQVKASLAGVSLLNDADELAAVLVMSHGENGYGAWANTSQITPTTGGDPLEDENTDSNATFIQIQIHLLSDDIVEYKSRWQLGR